MPQSNNTQAAPATTEDTPQMRRWLRCGTIGAPHGTQGAIFFITQDKQNHAFPYKKVLLVPKSEASDLINEIKEGSANDEASSRARDNKNANQQTDSTAPSGVFHPPRLPGRIHNVQRAFVSGGRTALYLDCIPDRSAAESLRGFHVFVDSSEVYLADDETLVADLLQCEIQCPEGVPVGTVVAVHDFGAQTTLEVSPINGKGTIYFPYLNAFVIKHDLARRIMVVHSFQEFLQGSP
jgi:ribosomal 30S subunit maturation factor RimM